MSKKTSGEARNWSDTPVLTYAVIFAAGMLAILITQRVFRSSSPPEKHGTPAEPVSAIQRQSKPWGNLEITPLVLERPEGIFQRPKSFSPTIEWVFPKRSQTQVADLIMACDLAADQKHMLLDPRLGEATSEGWKIRPPTDVVKQLPPATREKIYSVLAETPVNTDQRYAFFYRADGFDEWVGNSDLSPESVELVRTLCYLKGHRLYFADTQLFELLTNSNETERLIESLSRVPTLLMELRVTPDSNIDALLKYWGHLRRGDEVELLLRSMARTPGGASINVSYFMPPVPRLRLYTYPDVANDQRTDCFWTAFNFANEVPVPHLPDPNHYNQLLQSEYERVLGEKLFGDILLLLENGDTAAHMCIYIADDIVYTKNGLDAYQPWVLMRMKDMHTLYASDKRQEWRIFRKRKV